MPGSIQGEEIVLRRRLEGLLGEGISVEERKCVSSRVRSFQGLSMEEREEADAESVLILLAVA